MTTTYCSRCGTEMPADARFCSDCGEPRNEVTSEARKPNILFRIIGSIWIRLLGLSVFSLFSIALFFDIVTSQFPDPAVVQLFLIGFIGTWIFYGIDLWYRDFERETKILLAIGGVVAFVIVVPLYTIYSWIHAVDVRTSSDSKSLFYATIVLFTIPVVYLPFAMVFLEEGADLGMLNYVGGGLFVLSFLSIPAAPIIMYLDLRGQRLWNVRPIIWFLGAILLWIIVIPLYLFKRRKSFRDHV